MRTGEYGWTATHCSAPQSGSTVVEGCVEDEAGLDAPATNTDPRGTMGMTPRVVTSARKHERGAVRSRRILTMPSARALPPAGAGICVDEGPAGAQNDEPFLQTLMTIHHPGTCNNDSS